MKSLFALSVVALAALVLGGCASTPPVPRIAYPVTYNVQIGSSQLVSGAGPQSMTVSATQNVAVEPGKTLYYQVVSPIDVNVFVYEQTASDTRKLVSQMQGRAFNATITPATRNLQFVFQSAQPNTGGNLQFTLSDRAIPPAPTQTITTTTTTVAPPVAPAGTTIVTPAPVTTSP